ncbi:unnamed protein product [Mucor hiemalis]
MRVKQALSFNTDLAAELQAFADKLLDIGDGKLQTLDVPSTFGSSCTDLIEIPPHMVIPGDNLIDLLKALYPDLYCTPVRISHNTLINSAVLTPKNKDVATINSLMLDVYPGEAVSYLSADVSTEENQEIIAPVEYLNSVETGSLPPHKLILKIGVPIMILRNINPKQGLCNGTRLIVKSLLPHIIEASVVTGSHIGNVVYIPRIKIFTNNDPSVLIPFSRCQFPVRLAFGMTINKAQGQTMDRVGLYLPTHVFGHGQLYVAMSRVKTPNSIKIMVDKNCNSNIPHYLLNGKTYTRNVVYSEVFHS